MALSRSNLQFLHLTEAQAVLEPAMKFKYHGAKLRKKDYVSVMKRNDNNPKIRKIPSEVIDQLYPCLCFLQMPVIDREPKVVPWIWDLALLGHLLKLGKKPYCRLQLFLQGH